jgi:L-fuculokinase
MALLWPSYCHVCFTWTDPVNDHTLILDIGKTNAKLLLINAAGEVLASRTQANKPVLGADYWELGTAALEAWLLRTIPMLPERQQIDRINISTHGAAFCAIDDQGLVLPPIDYEWDGYGEYREAFHRLTDGFEITGSPNSPLGLNAGLQLFWLKQTQPAAWQRIRHWLPYPQFWAWWFCGVAASEVSSLGCHTHLWSPAREQMAPWTHTEGIASLFPPVRKAWEALGPLKPALASRLQLPTDCKVHVGMHDSNACLARHLRSVPGSVVVSTGTWCVVMAPGAALGAIDTDRDQLVNVSVEGMPVPTGRFMGGRMFSALCNGVDPALATAEALAEVQAQGWSVLSCESGAGSDNSPQIARNGTPCEAGLAAVPPRLLPALAAGHCASLTAHQVRALSGHSGPDAPVIIEGPLANNQAFGTALLALLEGRPLMRSTDPLEGTARGAWMLANWTVRAADTAWYTKV